VNAGAWYMPQSLTSNLRGPLRARRGTAFGGVPPPGGLALARNFIAQPDANVEHSCCSQWVEIATLDPRFNLTTPLLQSDSCYRGNDAASKTMGVRYVGQGREGH
jgi:hypothetical protein